MTYGAIDHMLVPRLVVDIYCDAAQGGDFVRELVEAGVVLPVQGLLAG